MIPLQEHNFTSAFVSTVLSLLWRRLQTKTMQKRKLNSDKLDLCHPLQEPGFRGTHQLHLFFCCHPVKSAGSRVGDSCVIKNALGVSIEGELCVFVLRTLGVPVVRGVLRQAV